jgi:hypothetical protein
MKGFPNQISDLGKLAVGMKCVAQLVDTKSNPSDDGILGEELVRAGVVGTGHSPIPIKQYLAKQAKKPLSNQSFRTSARGLRELFQLLGLININGGSIAITADGRQAAALSGKPLGPAEKEFWRRVLRSFEHQSVDTVSSHPYQVLLRLIARKPGITRAMCALALEAKDDSDAELERIVKLSGSAEETVRERIGVTKSNWDNAKKVLPSFAEQLGDVIKTGHTLVLADAPGLGVGGKSGSGSAAKQGPRPKAGGSPRPPRASRKVTPSTIGAAGLADKDEPPVPPTLDPAATAKANAVRADRLRRHNLLVRKLAKRLDAAGMELHEDPFDVLAILGPVGLLCEMKTLDGNLEDERERVREALSQLLYYRAFVVAPIGGDAAIRMIACFEGPISVEHQTWLESFGIATLWTDGDKFAGNALAVGALGGYLAELK